MIYVTCDIYYNSDMQTHTPLPAPSDAAPDPEGTPALLLTHMLPQCVTANNLFLCR